MKPLEVFIRDYGLTHAEIAQLTGKHRTNVSKMISNTRLLDNQTLSLCWNILLKVNSMQPDALMAKVERPMLQPPDWVEQEKLKFDIWQQKLTRLLCRLEKMQQQAGFWATLCHCGMELTCRHEWLQRHREEKHAMLKKCWEHEYLPLLLKVRQCEARIAAWEEAIAMKYI